MTDDDDKLKELFHGPEYQKVLAARRIRQLRDDFVDAHARWLITDDAETYVDMHNAAEALSEALHP